MKDPVASELRNVLAEMMRRVDAVTDANPHPETKRTAVRSLDYDIQRSANIVEKMLDDTYAECMYSALTNTEWICRDTNENWTASFRAAGAIVASLRPFKEDYMDFYCCREEGVVTKEIEADLNSIGWFYQNGTAVSELPAKMEWNNDLTESKGLIDRIGIGMNKKSDEDAG